MPLPKPRKGEAQDDFMQRCMHEAYGDNAPEDRTQEQAVAMCLDTWREAHGESAPPKKEMDKLIARSRVPVRVEVDPARYRPNDTPELVGDARRIHERLGWAPDILIDKTIDDLLEYWRA